MSEALASTNRDEQKNDWSSRKLLSVVLLFLFSGLSSLIYQVIWTRQMVFVFGSTTFASATVISAFMGGLAIGSFVAGRYSDKIRNPFLAYGILEGVIGVWALLAPFMFDAALPFYKMFWLQFHLSVLPFSVLRLLVVAVILLPPTACMGATLPLLSKFVTSSLSVVGNRVGTLYSINTLGAVTGAVISGFYLIPAFGLFVSTLIAASTNLLLAAAVFFLNKNWSFLDSSSVDVETSPREIESDAEDIAAISKASTTGPKASAGAPQASASELGTSTPKALSKAAVCTIVAFGISGFIAMIYEVAWTRALLLVIGSTTYAFSIMLSTFLIGIFIGSLVCARYVDRLKDPFFCFSVLQVLLGVAGVASIFLFNYLPYWNLVANHDYMGNPSVGMAVRFLLAGSVLLPITLSLGATFPLAVRISTIELDRIGKSVGTLYSVNTLGAILGSFAAGFLIIPAIGGEQSLVSAAAANTILGAALLLVCCSGRIPAKTISTVTAIGLVFWAFMQPKVWDLHMLTSSQKVRRGMNWTHQQVQEFSEWMKLVDSSFQILSWKDGMCANVAVVQFPDKSNALFTNGHIDASDGETDMPTQALLPAIPLLLKPNAKDVADVGWGSGCTMGYALLFDISKMVCAEIEPEVIATSKFFHSVNLSPENDPRLKIEINDGRNYLLATNESFDIITSEPSNPWQAGVCNLYTQEYFKICHDRLKPGGVFTMWWQSNEVSSNNLCRVFSALKKVFKHLIVFQTYPGDIAVCASDDKILINLNDVDRLLKNQAISKNLAKYGFIETAEDLPIKICMSDEAVEKVIQNVPPNTDDKNHIEFDVSRTYEQKNFTIANAKWFSENAGPVWNHIDWGKANPQERAQKMAEIAERALQRRKGSLAEAWASQSINEYPNSFAYCVLALVEAQRKGNLEKGYALADYALTKYADERSACTRGIVELFSGTPMKARKDFEFCLSKNPKNSVYRYRLAQTYLPEYTDWYQIAIVPMKDVSAADTDPQKAYDLLAPILNDSAFIIQNPSALSTAAAALYKLNDVEKSMKLTQEFLKVRPDDITANKILGSLKDKSGDKEGASTCAQRVRELSKAAAEKLCHTAEVLISKQKEFYAIASLKRALGYDSDSADARTLLKKLALNNADANTILKELSQSNKQDNANYESLQNEKLNSKGKRNEGESKQPRLIIEK